MSNTPSLSMLKLSFQGQVRNWRDRRRCTGRRLRRLEVLAKVEVGRARRGGWLREVGQRLVLLAVVHDPRARAARRGVGSQRGSP